MDIRPEQQMQQLPWGKRYHFFIVAAEEDRDKVLSIVSSLKENFNLACLYEASDCQPGWDKFEFIKTGMMQSAKVVLFLSHDFLNDGMCTYQRNMALAASLDVRIACILPVLLEELDSEEVSDIANLTFINAIDDEVMEVSSKIAESVSRSDLHASMFPNECKNVFARFENGYRVEFPVRREALRCNRPAKYKFHVNQAFRALLNDSKMKVPAELLKDVVKFINKEPILKSYDFLKKRNIFCLWIALLTPFALLIGVWLSLIVIVATCTQDRPDPDSVVLEFWGILAVIGAMIGDVLLLSLILLVLAVPRICHREKRDTDLQMKICQHFLQRCIGNDIIIVFSGRKNRRPSLHVIRYSFDKCQVYLENVVRHLNYNAAAENMTATEYANHLLKQKVSEMSIIMSKNYEDLPDASYPRHNVRKGKMCVCQQVELNLRTVQQR